MTVVVLFRKYYDFCGLYSENIISFYCKWEYKIYPLSFAEMVTHHGEKRLIPHRYSPSQFLSAYPDTQFQVIHYDNMEDFLL